MLVAETIRQAAIVLARDHLGAANDVIYLVSRAAVTMNASSARLPGRERIVATAEVDRVCQQDGTVVAFRIAVGLAAAHGSFASGFCQLRVVNRDEYGWLRDGSATSEEFAGDTALDVAGELRLERSHAPGYAAGLTWRLDIRYSRSEHFLLRQDHLPASLLLDALGRACREETSWHDGVISAIDLTFPEFLELGATTHLSLCPIVCDDSSARFALFFEQEGTPAVVGEMTFTRRHA